MQFICFRQYMLKKGESIDQVTSSTVWFCPQIKVIQSVAVIEEERNQINTLSPFFFLFYALFFMNLLLPGLFSFSLPFFPLSVHSVMIQVFILQQRLEQSVFITVCTLHVCDKVCLGVVSVSSTSPCCTEEVSWSLTCHNKHSPNFCLCFLLANTVILILNPPLCLLSALFVSHQHC